MVRIAPSTAPMHGVQPMATSTPRPTARALRAAGSSCIGGRALSRSRIGPKMPVVTSPRPMISTPATWRTSGRSCPNSGCPMSPTETPSSTNRTLKPSTNSSAWPITAPRHATRVPAGPSVRAAVSPRKAR